MLQTQTSTFPHELNVEDWDREYSSGKVIPSSSRTSPAKILTAIGAMASLEDAGDALDVGCGNGRNSVYLARMGWQVDSIDASGVAANLTKQLATESSVADRVKVEQQVLHGDWSIASNAFDLVLDSYVLCHYSDEAFISNHLKEAFRVLRSGGRIFSAFFSVDDVYYQKVGQVVDSEKNLVLDPNNHLAKKLYEENELRDLLSSNFQIEAFMTLVFNDICLGESFKRSIFGVIAKKM